MREHLAKCFGGRDVTIIPVIHAQEIWTEEGEESAEGNSLLPGSSALDRHDTFVSSICYSIINLYIKLFSYIFVLLHHHILKLFAYSIC